MVLSIYITSHALFIALKLICTWAFHDKINKDQSNFTSSFDLKCCFLNVFVIQRCY